jgi:hypothetical protein
MDEKGYQIGITGRESVVIMRRGHSDGYAGGAKHCEYNISLVWGYLTHLGCQRR